ncbi:MAG: efflux RND transporter periplasmic adaptor subunit [Phycisphaerales bacterium]|nr:efflux RND transporter periplasmic adaptor subunit [Phycisphaerales bacterium]
MRNRLAIFGFVATAMGGTAAVAQHGRPPAQVVVAPVVARDTSAMIRLVGTVRADRRSVVAAEVEGIVSEWPADEGAALKAGDVICQLDPTVATMWRDEAQRRLDALQARLDELKNGERRETLERLRAAVAEFDAVEQQLRFERDRQQKLFENSQTSAKEQHDAEMEHMAAAQRLAQARFALEQAENGARAEVIAQARAEVEAQRAVVARLSRNVEKTRVVAPFDGYVVQKRSEIGEWVSAGDPVCELVAIDKVRVRADAPESAIRFARPGAPAILVIEALGETRNAEISRLIPMAVENARTFPVEVDVENADGRLLPGMFVWTHVPCGPSGTRMMAPKDALVPSAGSLTVYVIRPGENGAQMAIPTPVRTGIEAGLDVELISDAIHPGDLVVSRANERLMGPSPVVFTPPGGATPKEPAAPEPSQANRDEPSAHSPQGASSGPGNR